MVRRTVMLFGLILLAAGAALGEDYQREIEQWRAQRLSRLTAPDGWLSLVGLHWLQPGENTVGSDADNRIVLPGAPGHLGTVTWAPDDLVTVALKPDARAAVDGDAGLAAPLRDDTHGQPTVVRFGSVQFYLVTRGGKKALRIKDSNAPTRTHFLGLDYFPVDTAWRITARWVNAPRELAVRSMIGATDQAKISGKAVFEKEARTYEMVPVEENPDNLFFVFSDATSGQETYAAARFLYAQKPQNGKVTLDFNQAYNPPCAFTSFATCPLPPEENRLACAVRAGEKKYRGDHEE